MLIKASIAALTPSLIKWKGPSLREVLLLVLSSACDQQINSEHVSEKHDECWLHLAKCRLPDGVGVHLLITSKKQAMGECVILQIIHTDPGWLQATSPKDAAVSREQRQTTLGQQRAESAGGQEAF